MSKICPNCRIIGNPSDTFCGQCGGLLQESATLIAPQVTSAPQQNTPTYPPIHTNNPPVTTGYNPQQPYPPADNKKTKQPKQKKVKQKVRKEKNRKKTLIKLVIFICSVILLFGIWFAVGNQVTLTLHTNKDLETLNSGSLDVPGAHYNKYAELPDYVVEMLGEDPDTAGYGPLMSEIIPHIRVERNKVNGWFGQKSVEYTITAPDMESWLINLDENKEYTEETLLADMIAYIPDAPERTQVVIIDYAHDGLFSWTGNYMALDFANAVSGGINSAYNTIYDEISEDLEAALNEKKNNFCIACVNYNIFINSNSFC